MSAGAGDGLLGIRPGERPYRRGRVGRILSGFKHPISGLDHILAMVSVGLWGAQLGAPAIWLLPVTFPIVMASVDFSG